MNIHTLSLSPTSAFHFILLPSHSSPHVSFIHLRIRSFSSLPTRNYCWQFAINDSNYIPSFWNCSFRRRRRRLRRFSVNASRRETPYEVLGVSPSATTNDIKRAYRKLALKYHPDVNKEANGQEKFMRIKHAYNTLLNSDSRRRYDSDSGNQKSDFSYSTGGRNGSAQEEEEFYGFGDFFRDLQEEFQNWEASAEGKPKSLWEELGEIGEDFVEFMEKELNITDQEGIDDDGTVDFSEVSGAAKKKKQTENKAGKEDGVEDDEFEAALAQLKKELGL